MQSERIYLIISRSLSDEISAEERQELERWIEASSENRQLFTELTGIWNLSGKMNMDLASDTQKAWKRIAEKTSEDQPKHILHPYSYLYKVAASLLVLVFAGTLLFLILNRSEEYFHENLSNTPEHVILPDSSEVWLNQNASLRYSGDFRQDRHLRLTGEAFFEVKRDVSRPFTVETNAMLTSVLGTSFFIKAQPQSPQQEVIVTTGKVQVSTNGQQSIILEPGTKATYHRETGSLLKATNEDSNYLAWKERKLHFRNAPLSRVVGSLEEYFQVDIELEHPGLRDCQVTSDFNDPSIEEVMQVLSLALDITYTSQNGQYLLQGAGCKQ